MFCHLVCLHMISPTLYTTLPHNLIKEKLTELIEQTVSLNIFYFNLVRYTYEYIHLYLLNNIFIRFGSKLHRQIVGILMGTNFF